MPDKEQEYDNKIQQGFHYLEETFKDFAEDVKDGGKQMMNNKLIILISIVLISSLIAFGCYKAIGLFTNLSGQSESIEDKVKEAWAKFADYTSDSRIDIGKALDDYGEEAQDNLIKKVEIVKSEIMEAVQEANYSSTTCFAVGAFIGAFCCAVIGIGWYKAMKMMA